MAAEWFQRLPAREPTGACTRRAICIPGFFACNDGAALPLDDALLPGELPSAPPSDPSDVGESIPGTDGWRYGEMAVGPDGQRTVVIRHDSGVEAAFSLPEFVSNAGRIQDVALIVAAEWADIQATKGTGG